MTSYLSTPQSNFTFDNVFATGEILLFNGSNLPQRKSSRNSLVILGNLLAKGEIVRFVPQNYEYTPTDLFFDGNIYVSGDAIAHLIQEYIPEQFKSK